MKNPTQGGTYLKASPEADPVFVSGTHREQTDAERAAVDEIRAGNKAGADQDQEAPQSSNPKRSKKS